MKIDLMFVLTSILVYSPEDGGYTKTQTEVKYTQKNTIYIMVPLMETHLVNSYTHGQHSSKLVKLESAD